MLPGTDEARNTKNRASPELFHIMRDSLTPRPPYVAFRHDFRARRAHPVVVRRVNLSYCFSQSPGQTRLGPISGQHRVDRAHHIVEGGQGALDIDLGLGPEVALT